MVIDLPISTTSNKHPWFDKSFKGEQEYVDFYVWKDRAQSSGEKFWSRAETGSKYYLHYEGKEHWPILNWDNNNVKEKIVVIDKFVYSFEFLVQL